MDDAAKNPAAVGGIVQVEVRSVSNPVTICDVGPEEMLDLPRAADSPECQVTLDLCGPEQGPFEPMPPCMEFYKVEGFSMMIRFLPVLFFLP